MPLKNKLKNTTEFREILEDNTKDYKGDFANILVHAPKIYSLLCRLLDSNNISTKNRSKITSVIAYFILPKDIISEEVFGTKGYIDDIYLCLYLLKELEEKHEIEELIEYWEGDIKTLKELLSCHYEELNKKFNNILKEMLDYIGLR